MDLGIISSRYARALLKYAIEKGEITVAYQAMVSLSLSFMHVDSLRETLQNPILSPEKKLTILKIASGNAKSVCIHQFFKLVIDKKRVDIIQYIAQSFIEAYRRENHLIHSQLTVVSKPDETLKKRLEALVRQKTNSEVEFEVKVDPSIIGGFILEYDTYRLDASIQGQLHQIKKQLSEKNHFQHN